MGSVNLKSIAAHFNVSIAAVSKALNGLPGVSEELRSQIVEYAKENQYIPNMFGRGLKGIRCGTIGMIMPDNSNPVFSRQIKAIEHEARKNDYNLILCNSSDDWKLEKEYISILLQRSVDGVLIIPAAETKQNINRYEMLEQKKIPFVMMNRSISGYAVDTVKPDYKKTVNTATTFLIQKGHTKILYVAPKQIYSSSEERLDGFSLAHAEMSVPFDKNSIYYCDQASYEAGYKVMGQILDSRRDFTAVLAFNDYIAFGLMRAILEKGLRIPEDIALMGYDDIEFCDVCAVPLTTMRQESALVGQISFGLLLQRMNGSIKETEPARNILLPGDIVERKSV